MKRRTIIIALAVAIIAIAPASPVKANPVAAAVVAVGGGAYVGYLVGGTVAALKGIRHLRSHLMPEPDPFSAHAIFAGIH